MPLKPRQMVRILRQNVFYVKSQNGSSPLKMYNPITNVTVIIPIHAKELGKGIQNAIFKEAGINR